MGMFEPHKWDVLVRVLQTPGSISGKSMSSKSSKSYKTSKSGTEYDLKSVAETTVDFGVRRSEFDSESSFSGRSGRHSQYTAGARSMADRSGTRSQSTTATGMLRVTAPGQQAGH